MLTGPSQYLDFSSFLSSGFEPPHYLIKYWPNGWFDLNSSQQVDYLLDSIQSIDAVNHRVNPTSVDAILNEIQKRRENWSAQLPWNAIVLETITETLRQIRTFTKTQVFLDEEIISCALERYYLKNHCYPKTLAELVPAFATALPNDIFGGAPYKYVLKSDGTYLLYSIGWDEKDDVGKPFSSGKPETGDWVWPKSL